MRYLGGLIVGAAAVAAAIYAGYAYKRKTASGQTEPVLRLPNPFIPKGSAAELEQQLGFRADAPKGADLVTYSVLSGNIANIDFEYAQYRFVLRASKSSEDVSGLYGQTLSPETVDPEYHAVLESVLTGGLSRRLTWCKDGIYFTLVNTDGADPALLRRIYREVCPAGIS